MTDLARIRQGMAIIGSDGEHLGTVEAVEGDRIRLAESDAAAGGEHHYVAADLVTEVGDEVQLSQAAAKIKDQWRGKGVDVIGA